MSRSPRIPALALTLAFVAPAGAQGIRVSAPLPRAAGDVSALDLTPDGTQAVYIADQELIGVPELFRVPADAHGPPVRISGPMVAGGHVYPFTWSESWGTKPIVISPTGDRLVYLADQETQGDLGLYSARLDGPANPLRLAHGFAPYYHFEALIEASGERVVYVATPNGQTDRVLFSARLDGSAAPLRISAPGFHIVSLFALSQDGAYVTYLSQDSETQTQLWRAPTDGSAPAVVVSQPFASGPGVRVFALSPDATRVVYAAGDGTEVRLYSRASDGSGSALQLNDGPLKLEYIRISPDGARALYRETLGTNIDGFFSVPLDRSSNPLRLNSTSACTRVTSYAFSPDSARAVFAGDEGRDCLYSAPLDGSAPAVRLHARLPAFTRLGFSGRISADSRRVAYVADAQVDERFELYSTAIDGSEEPRRLDPAGQPASDIVAVSGGERVVFASDPTFNGAYELFVAQLDGSQPARRLTPTPLTSGYNPYRWLGLTPDGQRAVYLHDQVEEETVEAWSVPLDGSSLPRRLNASLHHGPIVGDVQRYDFAANGRRLYEANGLYSVDVEQRPRPTVLERLPGLGEFALSPDRTRVYYRAYMLSDARLHLFTAPVDASAPPVEITGSNQVGEFLRPSPVGDWILCERSDHLLERCSLAGSIPLSSQPVFPESQISADGAWVVFRTQYPTVELFSVPADGGTPIALQPAGSADARPGFQITRDGLRVLFTAFDAASGRNQLYRAPISGGAAPTRLSLPTQFVYSLELSPDGLGVAYNALDTTTNRVELYGVQILGTSAPVRLSGPMVAGGQPGAFEISAGVPHLVYPADQDTDDVVELYAHRLGASGTLKLSAPLVANGDVSDFRLSADGAWVVYRADGSADERYELYAAPTDGSRPAVRLDALHTVGDVAVDYVVGSEVVVFRGNLVDPLEPELFAVPLDASRVPRRLNGTMSAGGGVASFKLAPDEDSVLYLADQETDGVYELYEALLGRPVRGSTLRRGSSRGRGRRHARTTRSVERHGSST